MAKNKVNAKSFAHDIKHGAMSDEDLIAKYHMDSQAVLERLFSKLMAHKLVTQKDIDDRYKATFEVKEPNKLEEIKARKNTQNNLAKYSRKPITASKKDQYTIIGGSFGLKGELVVQGDTFNVFSTQTVSFEKSHVQDILLSNGKKTSQFSILSFILGLIITIVLTFVVAIVTLGLLSTFVFVVGMVITIVGSFYTSKEKSIGTILLKDGKKIEVTGKLDKLLSAA